MSPHSSDIILHEIAQAISTASGEEFFRRLAEALCQTLEADFAFIGRLDADDPNRIHVMAVCVRGEIGQNFSYHLHGTPCENVVGREPCHYPRNIQSLFPEDHMLVEMGIESYVGYPLFGSARQPLGLLAVMHSRPIPEEEPATSVLRICATRAAAELERMRSDQALRESEEHYRVLTQLAPVGIFRTDTEGHCIYVNKQWCDIAGIGPEQAYGEGWARAIHPDDRKHIFERWYAAAKNDLPFQEECRMQCPDGVTTWVLAQASAEKGADGRVTSYVGTITDITERKRTEQTLRESEERFGATFNQAAVGIAHVAPDGRWLRVNQKLCEIVGYTEQELLQRTFQDITHPDDLDADLEHVRQVLAGEIRTYSMEKRYFRKDGSIVWINLTVSLVRDEQDAPKYFISVIEDISGRKLAEEQMRKLSSVVEQTADSVMITDRDGVVQYVNPAYEKITGYTREEVLGKKASILKSGKHDKSFYERLWDTIQRGEVFRERFINRKKDGSLYHEEKTITPLKNESGDITHFVSTGKDITERVRTEEALAQATTEWTRSMDFIEDAMYLIDTDDKVIRANRAFYLLTGLTPEQVIGRDTTSLMHPQGEAEPCPVCRARRERRDAYITMEAGDPTNPIGKPIEVMIRMVRDNAGDIVSVVMGIHDLTRARQVEEEMSRSAAEWTYAMNFIEDPLCLVDLEDKVIRVNRAFYQFTGRTPETTLGRTLTSLMHPKGEAIPCPVCQARKERRDAYITREADDPTNPTGRPTEVTVRMIRNDAGEPTGMLVGIRDLTRTRRAEEELRANRASLIEAQRIARLGNWDWNIATNELRWSDEIYRIFGLKPQEFGATYEAFLDSVHPDDRQSVIDAVNKTLHEKAPYSIDHRIVRPDGTERVVHEQAEIAFDENDKPIRMVGTVQDVTERKQAQEQLIYLAHYDTLTGLPNRILLQDRLRQAMLEADRRERLVAVMFLDLDRFKIINDTLGHDVGDALLKEVAGRLTACLRAGDAISRLGGDEFTVILANVAHVDDVSRVAQKIIDSFTPPFQIAGREMFISTSIGITLYPLDDSGIENLMRNADAAMYHAKEMGRNTFQFYTAELNRRTAKRMALETALRHALERDELLLHFQPQVNLKTGKIIGAEALLRWQHPEMGLIPPLDFIPLAEETGLIIPIGEWVLRAACRQARTWREAGFRNLQIAVNISGRQFQHRNLAKLVKKVLKETGLDPRHLDIELTESLLMHNTGETLAAMDELHALGVAFSMDDFGTGYSSLSYLKRFPIDTLKIDRSFVRDIPRDPDDAALAQAIIAMARSLGIRVIAEGVETARQVAFLRARKCDGMQGYYFSKPVSAEAMTRLLQKGRRLALRKLPPPPTNARKKK